MDSVKKWLIPFGVILVSIALTWLIVRLMGDEFNTAATVAAIVAAILSTGGITLFRKKEKKD